MLLLAAEWRKNEENMIITLDTPSGTMKFKIFSLYKVDYTTDYLITDFDSDNEKQEFINLIRGRSNIKSNLEVGINDNILTLSTIKGGYVCNKCHTSEKIVSEKTIKLIDIAGRIDTELQGTEAQDIIKVINH